jgi:hypothetical protein
MDTIVLHVEGDDPDTRKRREDVATQVRDYFVSNFPVPSDAKVVCYLDKRDVNWLKEEWGGESNRGIHWPIRG